MIQNYIFVCYSTVLLSHENMTSLNLTLNSSLLEIKSYFEGISFRDFEPVLQISKKYLKHVILPQEKFLKNKKDKNEKLFQITRVSLNL